MTRSRFLPLITGITLLTLSGAAFAGNVANQFRGGPTPICCHCAANATRATY